jgi:hypothetical protein
MIVQDYIPKIQCVGKTTVTGTARGQCPPGADTTIKKGLGTRFGPNPF